jgi:hypothetical protein
MKRRGANFKKQSNHNETKAKRKPELDMMMQMKYKYLQKYKDMLNSIDSDIKDMREIQPRASGFKKGLLSINGKRSLA